MSDATPPDHDAAPQIVARHPDRGGAEVTRARLEAFGLSAEIIDEVEGGTVPVSGEPGVAVAVSARDADMARAVLDGPPS